MQGIFAFGQFFSPNLGKESIDILGIICIEFSHVCFIGIQCFRCEHLCDSGVKNGKADIYTNIMQALGFLAMHIEKVSPPPPNISISGTGVFNGNLMKSP